jgi:hypothetical protein
MTSTLQQLNISYHSVQDRLLLRANGGDAGEFKIWLTRRYTELLLNLLLDMMEKEGGIREIASHRDTVGQLKGGAFAKDYETPAGPKSGTAPGDDQTIPLRGEGILGFRINANRHDDGNLVLQLLPEQGVGLNLNLNRTSLFMLYNLLEQGLAQTNWLIPLQNHHKEPVH